MDLQDKAGFCTWRKGVQNFRKGQNSFPLPAFSNHEAFEITESLTVL